MKTVTHSRSTEAPRKKKGRISSGISNLFGRSRSRHKSNSDVTKLDTETPVIDMLERDENHECDEEGDINSIQESIQESIKNSNTHSSRKRPRNDIRRFRGFSTSISSLFLDEQVVCGAVACFGLLASSRTEHLLNVRNVDRRMANGDGLRAPSKVLSIALFLSIASFSLTYAIWGFGNDAMSSKNNGYRALGEESTWVPFPSRGLMKVYDYDSLIWAPVGRLIKNELSLNKNQPEVNRILEDSSSIESAVAIGWKDNQELAYDIRVLICMIFFLLLGFVGRRRRMRTRYTILKARAQDDRIHRAMKTQRENHYDAACSHTLCGCYPIDEVFEQRRNSKYPMSKRGDCVSKGFSIISTACCGKFCRFWVQCLSICALAQEAREARLLVAPKLQHLDFITHQPFDEYYKDIYFLRRKWKGLLESKTSSATFRLHIGAISTLSRHILFVFIATTVVIILTERFNPRASFDWGDAFVLIMTFVQSFIVLGIVHGIFHKSDLSLDAVIKFFAAGFVIAFPTAFVLEGVIINLFLAFVYIIEAIFGVLIGNGFIDWVDTNYRLLLIISEIIQSFLMAAATEEFCKYYTFRTIEHPDLIFLTGLDRSEPQEDAFNGGQEVYPFSRDNTSKLPKRSFEYSFSPRYDRGRNQRQLESMLSEQSPKKLDKEPDIRTVRQCAAAVTIAMISVAQGLACAENFVYVFFLGGNDTKEELIMLLLRSIFPLHALTAAMQSIGVIKNFLEEDNQCSIQMGVGEIIFPAILLHGVFDSVLMLLNSYIEFSWEDYYQGDIEGSHNAILINIFGAICVFGVIALGVIWYLRKNRSQKLRLRQIEELQNEESGERMNNYLSPTLETPMELI